MHSSVPLVAEDPERATFTMRSSFVAPGVGAVVEARPRFATGASTLLLIYDLSSRHRMGVEWESSEAHCQGIYGVWNVVAPTRDNGGAFWITQVFAEPTSDILIVRKMVRSWSIFILRTYSPRRS